MLWSEMVGVSGHKGGEFTGRGLEKGRGMVCISLGDG